MAEKEKRKEPTVKTVEDKGTKFDYVNFGNGKEAFVYQSEKIRKIEIGGFKLNWGSKYNIMSPEKLSDQDLTYLSGTISTYTGSCVMPKDLEVTTNSITKTSNAQICKPKEEK
jgi:hypothetical protein